MSKFVVVIPSRFASTRLPGKPLLDIGGKPMLQHVWERANESTASEVIIATDDERIASVAETFGAVVCMTAATHQSGTDRIAEVADVMGWDDDQIVVNLQGDEPAMPAVLLDQCAALLDDAQVDIGTLASPFASEEDFLNPNCVKVVCDQHGHAIYFSRAAIPFAREGDTAAASAAALHHHGIYGYRCGALRRLVAAEPDQLERSEHLEQLRALSMDMKIAVGVPSVRPGIGVDTRDDIERVTVELEGEQS